MQWIKKNALSAVFYVTVMSLSCWVSAANMDIKLASLATIKMQDEFLKALPKENGQDLDFATRGFIGTLENTQILGEDGHVAGDPSLLDWMEGDAPATVNPSLWRHMKLQRIHGLFKVVDGVWQVRAIDGSNMTIIKGETGWIIIDPLLTVEAAAAAMGLVNNYLGVHPVKGVVYTHSHPDHFGGVRAIVSEGDKPAIIAPEHFLEETVAEYLIAGNIMARRGTYQLGMGLKSGPQGFVGGGLATKFTQGEVSLIAPNDEITHTGETRTIDGVTLEFQMVPETEAPAEMNVYLPAQQTLVIGEIVSCTMHNIQTPRGALVRDALGWAGYLTEALNLYAYNTKALLSGHCWPRFGKEAVVEHLRLQRDNYKFIHDQTVRLMNRGESPTEIAEYLKPPKAIADNWSTHGYYGTFKHNVKGVFQRYIGWWDGIPAHLDMLPAVEQGKRYVEAIGGADKVLAIAEKAMGRGEYRWSAEILNHVVFADPDNQNARALLADSYEQMGYQAESAVWRNYYLIGADELRGGEIFVSSWIGSDLVDAMTTELFLTLVATRLNPDKIGTTAMDIAVNITDRDEKATISISNAVMVSQMDVLPTNPDVVVSGERNLLIAALLQQTPLGKLEAAGLTIGGDRGKLVELQGALEPPPVDYPIVTP